MDPKTPNSQTTDSTEPVYQVMPQSDSYQAPQVPQPPTSLTPPISPTTLPKSQTPTAPVASSLPQEEGQPWWHNKRLFIIGGGILLVALAIAIVVFVNPFKKEDAAETPVTKLPKVWMQKYFNKEVCDDQSVCGDSADADSDGLANYDEFVEDTSPINRDTDSDGLADGDEVNIYKTDPYLKFTDRRDVAAQNNFTDGAEIKAGYDPLTPGLKLTDNRKAQIAADIQKYSLHEPSITTLGLQPIPAGGNTTPPPTTSAPQGKSVTVAIEGNKMSPATITINVGDEVVWLNKDQAKHHIASDPHPTHTALPGLESVDLATNQTYNFKFTKVGTWGYHDHLNPSIKGTVIVK